MIVFPWGHKFGNDTIDIDLFSRKIGLYFFSSTIQVTKESENDQLGLKFYPSDADRKKDLVYKWVKESTFGANGMPLNVQIIGRPWHEEEVLVAMKQLQTALNCFPVWFSKWIKKTCTLFTKRSIIYIPNWITNIYLIYYE